MSSRSQSVCVRTAGMWLAVIVLCGAAPVVTAQDWPTPKWELYGGYSFFYPGTDVHGLLPGGLIPLGSRLESNPRGIGAGVTYNFNRWLGLTGDVSGQFGSNESGVADRIDDASLFNVSLGPKLTFRSHYFSPFAEALVGWHRLKSDLFQGDDQVGFMLGGGLDLNLNRHFALRLLRADFVFSNHQYGPAATVPATDVRGARLQSGVVFMFGGQAGPAVSASCTVNPGEVMAGEPVTATVAGSNFNPRHTLNYTWNATGGQITGHENNASIDTSGTAGGNYRVTANIADPKAKQNGIATCWANFTVKEPPKNPPTMTCSASPSTLQEGGSSTITCNCTSPDNVAVIVGGWTASGGSISSSGANAAALNTSGASPGPITATATCSDARGLNTQAAARVTVETPPSPEVARLETRLALHSIYFPTAQPMVANPDKGLLASQRQTLISLADDFKKYLEIKPDAFLTLEGHADPRGSAEYNQALSERRVERTRTFLIERGIPAANLRTKAFGEQQDLTEAQVKDAVEQNPELTPAERQSVLDNITTILLASNRRVDITLSTTGQQSVRQYPFNATDSLTLLQEKGTGKAPAARRKAKPRTQP